MAEDKKKLAARIARYTAKLKRQGMASVRVWVPVDKAAALKKYAAKMRAKGMGHV